MTYEEAAKDRGWIETKVGWVHPIHDDLENDPPFKTAREVCDYEQVGPDFASVESISTKRLGK